MSGTGDPRRPVSSGSGAPPPRRPGGAVDTGDDRPGPAPAPSRPEPADTAPPRPTVVVPGAGPGGGDAAPAPSGRRAPDEAAAAPARRVRAPWWLRIVAWIVAVPLGLVLVGVPARKLGYLDSQKLLDVLIGKDVGRYLPLVVIVVLWAVVTAVLVQLIVEGGGSLLRRRRARRDAARV